MTTVQIELDDQGFEHLWSNSMAWAGIDWAAQEGRFSPEPSYKWKWSYFFDSYVAFVIAQCYLKSIGRTATGHSDDNDGGWVLLTDFASPCHQ